MSSPGRRRIEEIGDESRRRILDAAEELFAERGFDRTSFVDIAERSGISRGSIPWHFKNKDGLVIAVIERAIKRSMQIARYETVPSLSKMFDDYGAWVKSANSALFFMILTEVLGSTGTIQKQYQQFFSDGREGMERWLRAQRPEGVDAEVVSEQERAFAAALSGMLIGIHLQALVDRDSFDLDEALKMIARLADNNLNEVWADQSAPANRRRGDKSTAGTRGSRKRAD